MKKIYSVWLVSLILSFQLYNSKSFSPEIFESVKSENSVFNLNKFAPGDFTFTSTPTNETCTGNGKINVAVSNAIDGATYSIEVFLSSNLTTPVNTTSVIASGTSFSYLFNGLGHGNYTVRITESASSITTPKTQSNVIIYDVRSALSYTISSQINCSGTYDITVNVNTGTASTFTLKSQDGTTVIVPTQTSNVFTNVAAGTYRVDVVDICGQNVNQNYTVAAQQPYGLSVYYQGVVKNTCTKYLGFFYFNGNGGQIKFPLNYTISFSDGTPSISGSITNASQLTYDAPIPASGSITATLNITDGCGHSYTFTHTYFKLAKTAIVSNYSAGCGQYVNIMPYNTVDPVTLTFNTYPSGFTPNSYNTAFSNTTYSATFNLGFGSIEMGSTTNPLPPGTYTATLTDACGEQIPISFNIINPTHYLVAPFQNPGCNIGYGSTNIMATSNGTSQSVLLTSATVTSAPAGYTTPTSLPITNGYAALNNAPEGSYTILGKYICNGVEYTLTNTVNIVGLQITKNEITVTPSCGKFDLKIDYTATAGFGQFFLQKYNATTGLWTHPDYGSPQNPGVITSSSNAKMLIERYNSNGAMINTLFNGINYTYTGKMRVVFVTGDCSYVLKEFETQPVLNLNNYYVFNCSPSKITLAVDATGIQPLGFEIIEKDGVAMSIVNGANPVFTNLDPGTYKVKVTDGCGNSKIFTIFANGLKLPAITANLCDGQNGTLSLPQLSFMNITWNFNGGTLPSNVSPNASNNYILNFTPYNKAIDAGTYQAVLNYNFATTCQPVTINYTLTTTNDTAPQAGTGQTVNLNGTSVTAPIDLFTYLTGTYDTNGVWTETTATPSNLLLNNVWYGNIANGGTYTFQYTVKGTCSGTATSFVTIILDKACYKTPVLDGNTYSGRFGITSLQRAGAERDNWPMVRQSAHAVLEAKTKGFVLNKMNFDSSNNPIGIPASNFVEGMAVYDTTNNCMKVYFGTTIGWKCVKKGGCAPN